MEMVQVELPPAMYRKLVAEATRQGKPVALMAQEWLIERAGTIGALPGKGEHAAPRYQPVQAGGIWAGVTISDDDIAAVRREMQHRLGEDSR